MNRTPIYNGEKTVHDDQKPHIDEYGLYMLECLKGYMGNFNEAGESEMAQFERDLEEIIARYR